MFQSENNFNETLPKVVVLGAGFGGLWAVKALSSAPVNVTLIDRNNYHTFLPLLYQVGAAELEAGSIAYPIRTMIRKMRNTKFVMTDVRKIDTQRQVVEGYNKEQIPYDYLIIAAGSVTQFFNTPGAERYCFQLKTVEQAILLRNHILNCFERALRTQRIQDRRRILTFTIIGGGATGVEFAGALAELVYGPLVKDYPDIDFKKDVRISLIEAAKSVLLSYPPQLQEYTTNRLRKMGVEVLLETFVTSVTQSTIQLKDRGVMSTETVVWTAGVSGSPIAEKWGLPTGRNSRALVNPTLQVDNLPNVYVVGDLAAVKTLSAPHPMLAPVATQQGMLAARNIIRQINKEPLADFHYNDRGSMVTIGRNKAVAMVGKKTFTGFIAWFLWLIIHLMNLVGFKNRITVLISWAWDYLFYERSVRIILPFKRVTHVKLKPPQDDNVN
ncbi:NADH dehydrogenase, FAD-containing subunit [Candidatus Magnetoovum chiemensis]|nr:NADH dehydrogenase, FAD-containing subunit [Candidatus Magnetoovum chiemensis]